MDTAARVAARYLEAAVQPFTLDQARLRRWFEGLTRGRNGGVESLIVTADTGAPGRLMVHVNFAAKDIEDNPVHQKFQVWFEITPETDSISIRPKVRPVPNRY